MNACYQAVDISAARASDRVSSTQRISHAALTAALLLILLVGCSPVGGTGVPNPTGAGQDTLSPSQRCTSFCLDNGGSCIFGANYDSNVPEGILYVNKRGISKRGWEESTSGEVARWTSRYGSLTFSLVGYQYPWAGMNEAGLVISTMSLLESQPSAPDERPPLSDCMWVQYQLDNFSTIEEVIASEPQVRYSSPLEGCCHYLACDRTGSCATIEFLEGERVVHSGSELPVAALTNSPYEMSIQAWRERSREELAEVEEMVFSLLRFAIAADAVTGFEPTGSDAAVEAAFETLAQAADYLTVWSIVFDQENLQIHFRSSLNSQVRSIDFGELDFACGTPVRMLDIQADLAGDISGNLEPYSHEANLDLYAGVHELLGLEISRTAVDAYLRQLERYPCVDGEPHIPQDPPPISPWVWLTGAAVLVAVGLVVWYGFRRPTEPKERI